MLTAVCGLHTFEQPPWPPITSPGRLTPGSGRGQRACSKPYSGFSASMAGVSMFSSIARVLVTCGVSSGLYTEHSTSTSSPPRIGSG